jgi:nitroimidazol reductase NimA-like FMN-containing flavoprotein (pyridoxamine 5'-phosphate oxidase superfamily)
MHPKLQMTDDERDAVLARNKTVRVATNGSAFPHNVPVGYRWVDAKLFFPSDERSQKIANIERDDRVCCIVDEGTAGDEYDSHRGVMIQGRASVYDEDEHPTVKHDALLEYLFDGDVQDAERYERVDRVVVEVDPENVVTWDFSKV